MDRGWTFIKYLIFGVMSLVYGYLTFWGEYKVKMPLPSPSLYRYILIYLAALLIFAFEFTNWVYRKTTTKKFVCVLLAVLFVASFYGNHIRLRALLVYYIVILILVVAFFYTININTILNSFFFIVLPFLMLVLQSMEFGYFLAEDIRSGNARIGGNPIYPEMILSTYIGITIIWSFLEEILRLAYYEEHKKYIRKGRISLIHFVFLLILIGGMFKENREEMSLWGMMALPFVVGEYLDIMKLVRGKLLIGDGCTLAIGGIFGITTLPFLAQFCGMVNPPQALLLTLMMPIVLYIAVCFRFLPQHFYLYMDKYEPIVKDIVFIIWMSICMFLPFTAIYQEHLYWVNTGVIVSNIALVNGVVVVPCIGICLLIIVSKVILCKDKGIKNGITNEILGTKNIYMILAIGTSLGIGATSLVTKMYQGGNEMIDLGINSMCSLILLLLFIFAVLNILIREFAASMSAEEQLKR